MHTDYSFSGLYTDMYQLTMMQAHFKHNRKNIKACFDYFFRKIPFSGGFVVFAGLEDVLKIITGLRFSESDIEYLRKYNFDEEFLTYLENFKFNGNVYSVREGEIIFPNEPLVRVEGNIIETQLIETVLLNFLNFESLIATKASRMRLAAGDKSLSEFGLRRAQSLGAIYASRAAVIGGFDSTSNVYAGKLFDITAAGTMAHSFIESFDDELTAFRKYAEARPDNCTLLVDTYNTLNSGIPNAVIVAKEMEKKGKRLTAIRLDSGDLAYLSKRAREMLDKDNLNYVKIVASNRIDEYVLKSLNEQNAVIDIYGVGTNLVTGQPDAALDGVYKLSMADNKPRLKLSESISKVTLPGVKQVYRYYDDNGLFFCDAVVLADEKEIEVMYHPYDKSKNMKLEDLNYELLLEKVMEKGEILIQLKSIQEYRSYVTQQLEKLPEEFKRFDNPHIYKVGISENLMELRDSLRKQHRSRD